MKKSVVLFFAFTQQDGGDFICREDHDISTNSEFSQFGFATRAAHAGNDSDKDSGAIKRPITMANSYALPYDPTEMNWSSAAGNLYTRS